MKIKDIIRAIEEVLPLWLQEQWDNSGLQVGDTSEDVSGILIALDPTEAVIAEAVRRGCNLVVTHHPLLFRGVKRIGTATDVERAIRLAIRSGVTVYSAHTNADNAPEGLNALLARELGLIHTRPLSSIEGSMCELVTFVPESHLEHVRSALWRAGAGRIGQYDSCSFSSAGTGTFRPGAEATPFIGQCHTLEQVAEARLSVVLPSGISAAVVAALHEAHPYEMPAYSLTTLANPLPLAGAGIVGDLPEPVEREALLRRVRDLFDTDKMMIAADTSRERIQRIAICGGAGAFLWGQARRAGADLFITGEAKYNDYLDAEGLIFATVGHFESEVIATRLFERIIREQYHDTPIYISGIDNNRIKSIK